MQGTVSAFDEITRGGRVILDDGHEIPFSRTALEGSGLRLLRSGQRVQLETVEESQGMRVVALRIPTLP